jgi:hypothetical protein
MVQLPGFAHRDKAGPFLTAHTMDQISGVRHVNYGNGFDGAAADKL